MFSGVYFFLGKWSMYECDFSISDQRSKIGLVPSNGFRGTAQPLPMLQHWDWVCPSPTAISSWHGKVKGYSGNLPCFWRFTALTWERKEISA